MEVLGNVWNSAATSKCLHFLCLQATSASLLVLALRSICSTICQYWIPSGRGASAEAALSMAEGGSVHTGQEAAGLALSLMQIPQMQMLILEPLQDGIWEVGADVCQSRGPGHKGVLGLHSLPALMWYQFSYSTRACAVADTC